MSGDERAPRICVLAPTPQLTVTVEAAPRGPQIHVHFGGQGLWVARMAASLGAEVAVCGPFGGEAGDVASYLATRAGIRIRATPIADGSGAYVHDRRGEERVEIARMDAAPLSRHEVDDLFGAVLVEALDADVVVLTGPEPSDAVPADLYARLAEDLRSTGQTVVADLAQEAMAAAVEHGLDVLKMSHTEMIDAGLSADDSVPALVDGARKLTAQAVGAVLVSRAGDPSLFVTPETVHEAVAPPLSVVDHRGAGDSQTAGIAVGLARGYELIDAVRLGVAAGALNVTRHGLGSGKRDEIERLTEEVVVRQVGLA